MFGTPIAVGLAAALSLGMLAAEVASGQSPLSSEELSIVRRLESERVDTIERVNASVVSLFGDNKEAGGSGLLIDKDGFALTNHHVVAAIGKNGKAGLNDGHLYDWELVGTDLAGDIALIRLRGKDTWPFATLGNSNDVRIGQWVMAMGNPFALSEDYAPTVTLGIVSGVERYQGGAMVYGNCIQADCAINPGNSGGPLMNMRGEVIGINGRAAFATRGRVNVGVGFAVSSEQVKNFIPELMSARVAQHGTLDAQFAMRGGRVICEAINLDSRAARAGLRLGDQILSLNGTTIVSSNQLASLMSMLPCNWPVVVQYERDGKPLEFAVRLSALTYVPSAEDGPIEEDKKQGEPDNDKVPRDQGRGQQKTQFARLTPGSLLSFQENRKNANRLIDRWRNQTEANDIHPTKAIRWIGKIIEDAHIVDRVSSVICRDGRFLVTEKDNQISFYRGGTGFFRANTGQEPKSVSLDEFLSNGFVLQSVVQAARYNDHLWSELGIQIELDGGDPISGGRAYRIRISGKTSLPLIIWLSMDDVPQLLKVGFDEDGSPVHPTIIFEDYKDFEGFNISARRRLAMGVQAMTKREWVLDSAEAIEIPKELEGDKP